MYFQLFPPTHIHEGHHISSVGYSCIKDTTNRNIEHFVHFHVLFMSFSCFFVLIYWEFFHFNLLSSKHSATWRPAFIICCSWIPSCLAISFTAEQFHVYFHFYSSEQFHCSYLLDRTLKRENPVLPRIPWTWTSSWQKQKLCFYWVELCYNINSSPN